MPEATWTPGGGGIEARYAMMEGLGGAPGGDSGGLDGGTKALMDRLMQKKLREALAAKKKPAAAPAGRPLLGGAGGAQRPPMMRPTRGPSTAEPGKSPRQKQMEQMQFEDMTRTMVAKKAQPFTQQRMLNTGLAVMSPMGDRYKEEVNPAGYGYDDVDFSTSRGLAVGGNPMQRFQGHGSSTPVSGSIGQGGTTSSQAAALKQRLAALGR